MIDWNGNGKIDPTDIAVSIALDSATQEQAELEDEETEPEVRTAPREKAKWNWLRKWFGKK